MPKGPKGRGILAPFGKTTLVKYRAILLKVVLYFYIIIKKTTIYFRLLEGRFKMAQNRSWCECVTDVFIIKQIII